MEKKVEKVEEGLNLGGFTGTENYYRHNLGLIYTDGIKYLAEKAQCYWLIDIIASYNTRIFRANNPFQIWKLEASEGNSAVVTCKEDSDQPDIVKQEIKYTDFPFKYFTTGFECYCIDGTVLLKSEY